MCLVGLRETCMVEFKKVNPHLEYISARPEYREKDATKGWDTSQDGTYVREKLARGTARGN